MNTVTILGVKLTNLSQNEAMERIRGLAKGPKHQYIVKPNPEIIMATQKNSELMEAVNQASLSIPDGIGLVLAARWINLPKIQRIGNVDLMLQVLKLCQEDELSIGLLGATQEIALKTKQAIVQKYPAIKVSYTHNGYFKDSETPVIIQNINQAKVDILFVALGFPKQELWIAQSIQALNVKLAIAEGGSFDFISGEIKRAPSWIRKIGLEWLFRLILQPWRLKRQLRLILFLVKIIRFKISNR